MRRFNAFLIAICLSLSILVAGLFHALKQHFPYAPQINAEQKSETALKGEDHAKSALSTDKKSGREDTEQADEGSEFWPTLFGLKLKITDSLIVLFNLGLFIFTGLLWNSTEKLFQGSEKQIRAMRAIALRQDLRTQSALETANRSANAAERSLKETQRAFVYIDGFNFEMTTLADGPRDAEAEMHLSDRIKSDPGLYITYFAIQPRWKNGGTTPTVDLNIRIDWRAPGSPLPIDFSYRGNARPFFLGPQTIEPSEYIQMQGAQALVNWQWNPIPPAPQMLVWGRADYLDVFGEKHFTEWCYELRLSRPIRTERLRAEFIQWSEYNRTDKSS